MCSGGAGAGETAAEQGAGARCCAARAPAAVGREREQLRRRQQGILRDQKPTLAPVFTEQRRRVLSPQHTDRAAARRSARADVQATERTARAHVRCEEEARAVLGPDTQPVGAQ